MRQETGPWGPYQERSTSARSIPRDSLDDVAKHLKKQHTAVVDCRHDPQDIAVFGPLLMIHSKHYLNDLRDDALIEGPVS